MAIALVNFYNAQVNGYIDRQKELGNTILEGANYFWFFTVFMLITSVVFVIFSQFYRGATFIQGEELSPEAVAAE